MILTSMSSGFDPPTPLDLALLDHPEQLDLDLR